MQEVNEQRIHETMSQLVQLTSNVEEILNILRDKGAITEDEYQQLSVAETPFDKKGLFALFTTKEEEAFQQLVDALRSTGNEAAAEKLTSDNANANMHVDADVTVEKHPKPDQEGMALAVEIEKEFERIQSEVESEAMPELEAEDNVNALTPTQEEIFEDKIEQESKVRVEVTAPTESEPENEPEEAQVQENGYGYQEEQHEEEPIVQEAEEITQNRPESPPTPKKSVSFVEDKEPEPEPKEFILNDEDQGRASASPDTEAKSIVAMNRSKFEKPSPNGDAPKVKYSFAKKASPTGGVIKADDEPKESTVKNLRNFFQKLGSVETEDNAAVQKRPGAGVKTSGGVANRRTMI